jgi:rfaE bifunctional protein nucleotidyltransferase chain/domain
MGRVIQTQELAKIRAQLRVDRKKVVFTNGCFDILHRGHVEYLLKSKALGDVLVVGVNTDNSMRRIKGPLRPIVPQDDRAFLVAHLSPVDYVCLFDEETPLALISSLVPDILVKGADWSVDTIVGKDVVERAGGKVTTIDLVPNHSTSSIIEQIVDRFS